MDSKDDSRESITMTDRDIDHDFGIGPITLPLGSSPFREIKLDDLQIIRDLIPEGHVEVVPGITWPLNKWPSAWYRFWMRCLMGWKFKRNN